MPRGDHVRRNNAGVPVISPLSPAGRKDIEVWAEAEDLGVSGGLPIRERPKIGKLLSLEFLDEWDVLIIYKLDRGFRNHLIDELQRGAWSKFAPLHWDLPSGKADKGESVRAPLLAS